MVNTISPAQGSLGVITDRNKLLTYSITTDGEMSTITEKVNGVTIGIKNATSGQSLIAGMTQEQWDAVRFGKYGKFINTPSAQILSSLAVDWEQGGYSNTVLGQTIVNATGTTTLRLKIPLTVQPNTGYNLKVLNNYKMIPIETDTNGVVVKNHATYYTEATFTTTSTTARIYLAVVNSGNTTIVANDILTAKPTISTKEKTEIADNTLTVEMGSEKWTYTFDKRLATDADILSAVKAMKDSQETYLPAVKSKLASAVRGKGGNVSDGDSFEAMISAVGGMATKKWATGELNTSGINRPSLRGLDFKPSIIVFYTSGGIQEMVFIRESKYLTKPAMFMTAHGVFNNYNAHSSVAHDDNRLTVYEDGIDWYSYFNATFQWWAFE